MSGCGATCGIQKHRAVERDDALDRIARWGRGELDAVLPDLARLEAIAARCEDVLPVRATVRPGGEADRESSWIYLLAGLHQPSWIERIDDPSLSASPPTDRETYVRIGFSPIGPFVTLQEVIVEVERAPEGVFVTEAPLAGVEDRRLAMIVKGLQGVLRSERLVLLDMAFLLDPSISPDAEAPWFSLFEPLACNTTSHAFL